MKILKWFSLFFVLVVMVSCSDKKVQSSARTTAQGSVLDKVYETPEIALQELLRDMVANDTAAVYASMPSYTELVRINLGSEGRSQMDSMQAQVLASIFHAENQKHALRWMNIAQEKKFRYHSIIKGDSVQNHRGFQFVTGFQVLLDSADGYQVWPAVRTMVKVPDGYRIWTIRDVGKI